MTATALIIDDEPDIRELIAMTLTRMGLDHHSAANLEEARQLLNHYKFDICLTDMRLPDGNGVEFVRYIHSKEPTLPVAVITAHGNMEAAVDAMKNGAYDFVSKPVNIQQLRQLVVQAIALNASDAKQSQTTEINPIAANDATIVEKLDNAKDQANIQASNQIKDTTNNNSDSENTKPSLLDLSHRSTNPEAPTSLSENKLIGSSAPMQSLRQMIEKVSRTNAPVWITGESGTGKELIAKLIHECGPRAENKFVAINCGAIPSELMESELFGHLKGSFTGANIDKEGLFQHANGGTLFLDEVAELPLHMQVKLLRAIQERSIRPVGGSSEIVVDARILSASHKDLAAEVEAGRFRHDLYYRLNVISLNSPSLRERREDLPELCKGLLIRLQKQSGSEQSINITQRALDALSNYAFPGNVRELENLLERSVALIDNNIIDEDDLSLPIAKTSLDKTITPSAQTASPSTTNHSEASRIVEALNSTRWNRKAAAQQLGLTYRQLRYRIKQLGIDNKDD